MNLLVSKFKHSIGTQTVYFVLHLFFIYFAFKKWKILLRPETYRKFEFWNYENVALLKYHNKMSIFKLIPG